MRFSQRTAPALIRKDRLIKTGPRNILCILVSLYSARGVPSPNPSCLYTTHSRIVDYFILPTVYVLRLYGSYNIRQKLFAVPEWFSSHAVKNDYSSSYIGPVPKPRSRTEQNHSIRLAHGHGFWHCGLQRHGLSFVGRKLISVERFSGTSIRVYHARFNRPTV